MRLVFLLLACTGDDGGALVPGGAVVLDPGGGDAVDPDPVGRPDRLPPARAAAVEPVYDVVIVGAGVAGLAAAVEATRAGATVRVLEREDTVGGSANWAGGLMLFSGTPEQAALGVEDSPDALLAEWPTFTGGDTSDPWVRFFAQNNVPMVHDWLAEMGVSWSTPQGDSSAGTVPRIHALTTGGAGMASAIAEQIPISVVRFHAQAEDLALDGDGRVAGVVWTDLETGDTHTTPAHTVLVATGGFMHDLDKVRQVRPDLAAVELSYGSWPGADGNGLALLEAHGAATQNLDAVGLYAHGAPGFASLDELSVPFVRSVPWVNVDGLRFVDESTVNDFHTGDIRAAQPDGEAWMVFDEPLAASSEFAENIPGGDRYRIPDLLDAGLAVRADDLAGLADALAVDGDALAAEVEGFNLAATGAQPDAWRTGPNTATPVVTAPFYALPVATTAAKGFGGVDVDLSGRVLDTQGAVIPGLYAAGELTGMAGGSLVGDAGFTGSLSAVVLGGRVAGAAAAAEGMGR